MLIAARVVHVHVEVQVHVDESWSLVTHVVSRQELG
jgi:hypothetical protein